MFWILAALAVSGTLTAIVFLFLLWFIAMTWVIEWIGMADWLPRR
jgi:hypothetical protein